MGIDRNNVTGQDIDPSSVTADDLDIGGNDFIATGDEVLLPIAGTYPAESTSSSSYSDYNRGEFEPLVNWSVNFPSGVQTRAYFLAFVDGTNDQIDIRIRNLTDSEDVIEETGITVNDEIDSGPVDYTPTTTDSPIRLIAQFRNSDNASSVTISGIQFYLGWSV